MQPLRSARDRRTSGAGRRRDGVCRPPRPAPARSSPRRRAGRGGPSRSGGNRPPTSARARSRRAGVSLAVATRRWAKKSKVSVEQVAIATGHRRRGEALRRHVERHLPPVVHPGRQGEPNLSGDLRVHVQGVVRRVPTRRPAEAGTTAGGDCTISHLLVRSASEHPAGRLRCASRERTDPLRAADLAPVVAGFDACPTRLRNTIDLAGVRRTARRPAVLARRASQHARHRQFRPGRAADAPPPTRRRPCGSAPAA